MGKRPDQKEKKIVWLLLPIVFRIFCFFQPTPTHQVAIIYYNVFFYITPSADLESKPRRRENKRGRKYFYKVNWVAVEENEVETKKLVKKTNVCCSQRWWLPN